MGQRPESGRRFSQRAVAVTLSAMPRRTSALTTTVQPESRVSLHANAFAEKTLPSVGATGRHHTGGRAGGAGAAVSRQSSVVKHLGDRRGESLFISGAHLNEFERKLAGVAGTNGTASVLLCGEHIGSAHRSDARGV